MAFARRGPMSLRAQVAAARHHKVQAVLQAARFSLPDGDATLRPQWRGADETDAKLHARASRDAESPGLEI